MCWFDEEEELWFPLSTDLATGDLLLSEYSERTRNHIRVGMSGSRGQMIWDRELLTYVTRLQHPPNPYLGMIEEFGGVGGHVPGPPSATESIPSTEAPGSPRTQPANTFSAIIAVSTAPILFGAVYAGATALPAGPSPVLTVEGPVASPSAPAVGATGHGTKRGSGEESDEARKKNKKPKKAPTVQCSRQRLKGKRCKNKKN